MSSRCRFCGWPSVGTGSDSGIEMPLPLLLLLLDMPRLPGREADRPPELRSFETGRIGTPFKWEPDDRRPLPVPPPLPLVLPRKSIYNKERGTNELTIIKRENTRTLTSMCELLWAGRIGMFPWVEDDGPVLAPAVTGWVGFLTGLREAPSSSSTSSSSSLASSALVFEKSEGVFRSLSPSNCGG